MLQLNNDILLYIINLMFYNKYLLYLNKWYYLLTNIRCLSKYHNRYIINLINHIFNDIPEIYKQFKYPNNFYMKLIHTCMVHLAFIEIDCRYIHNNHNYYHLKNLLKYLGLHLCFNHYYDYFNDISDIIY